MINKQIPKLLYVLALLLCINQAYGQAQPAAEYLKSMNSFVAGSPEAAQIMKYQNYPVDLFSGTPQISYPIYTVQGKGISLPISFSYHAGGGVKVDEQASTIGLGWMLNAGGEITREIRGAPDDGGSGRLIDPIPVDTYASWVLPDQLKKHLGEWIDAATGYRDMEPDIFFYSFGSFSGKYIYDDNHQEFVGITEKGSVKISLDKPSSVWKIVTDDGTQYYFGTKENTATQIRDMNAGGNLPVGQPQVTSWKLSKIVNADGTDSIMLNYSYNTYKYYSAGANISYQLQNGSPSIPTRQPVNSYSYNYIDGISKLTSITSATATVTFTDESSNRLDLGDNQKALSKITVKDVENNVTDIFKFVYGYYDRPSRLGLLPLPAAGLLDKSLRLDGFIMYGNSESNPNPLSYSFQYNVQPLPTRLSFTKDFWGYPNSNTEGSMLAPKMLLNYGSALTAILPGADRSMDTSKIKAGILEQVTLPTGGTVRFNYEPNTIGYPIREATSAMPNTIGFQLYAFKAAMEQFNATYDTTFTINQPPNYVINNMLGGVIGTINISPDTATPNCILNSNLPYFKVEKIAGVPGTPDYNTPFGRTLQCGDATNVIMPNGVYKMTAYVSALNNAAILNSIRAFHFSVSYDEIQTTVANTYNVAGLRIKSIVATDPYSNVAQTRRFRYHDPVTDSSYGRFIGNSLSNYTEVPYDQLSIWLIRSGSYNMPGCGSVMSNVNYAKVIEEVSDNTTAYRVEHNYSTGVPFYPYYPRFLPPTDVECARGNEELTDYKKYASGAFVSDKVRKQVFNYYPNRLAYPDSAFQRQIKGVRCSYDTYFGGIGDGGWVLPPTIIATYWTNVNRVYMTSDTTIEYEGGSPKMTTWNSYKYGDYNQKLIESISQDSKGSITIQRLGYATDTGEPALASPVTMTAPLALANRVSDVLASRQYKDGQLLNQMVKRGHFSGSRFLVDSLLTAEYSNPLERELRVIDYDDYANPLSLEGRGELFRKYIWRKDRNLALATCTMPVNGNFVFTSFEYPDEYSAINNAYRQPTQAFAGKYSYYLNGVLAFPGFNATQPLEVYAWVNQGAFAANGVLATNTGRTNGAWTLYRVAIPAATTVNISGTVVFDQLTIVPAGSSFDASVYDAAGRITAKVNQNMQTTFFEYDAMSRLTRVKDEQGNIVKSSTYLYQAAQ